MDYKYKVTGKHRTVTERQAAEGTKIVHSQKNKKNVTLMNGKTEFYHPAGAIKLKLENPYKQNKPEKSYKGI